MEPFDFGWLGWKLLLVTSYFDIVLTISGVLFFLGISWAVWKHFSSEKLPIGTKIISFASLISIILFVSELWSLDQNYANYFVGLFLHILCLFVFLASIHASKKQKISLAFDDDLPDFLIKDGIYRYIRHPFYLSYIIFWYGNYIATTSVYCLLSAITMSIIYIYAIFIEEQKFENSSLAREYGNYKSTVGMLVPRVFSND